MPEKLNGPRGPLGIAPMQRVDRERGRAEWIDEAGTQAQRPCPHHGLGDGGQDNQDDKHTKAGDACRLSVETSVNKAPRMTRFGKTDHGEGLGVGPADALARQTRPRSTACGSRSRRRPS